MHLTGTPVDYLIVFAAGVLVSFTPCVYPVLPITAAVIAGANTRGTARRGLLLSLLYVLGIACSYSLLALLAAMTGRVFGSLQNSPWVFLIFGNIFLLFALVMFDLIPFPAFGAGTGALSDKKRGSRSVFLAGLASGFVVGPCTAPVLGALLLFASSGTNLLYAMSLLFVFAYGVGFSLILAGTFSGFLSSLPKSGVWLETVKKIIGLVFVILAEYYLVKAGSLF